MRIACPFASFTIAFANDFALPFLFAYLFANVAQSGGVEDCKNKKNSQSLRIWLFLYILWVEDGIRTHDKNHHIPHIINKLQQQPKSTFQKGYKYVHNFCCLNKDIQKYVNNKIPDN